ncbi:MAG: FtsQ-type POTRA domain-containing protein [Gloeocapsa sp. DLM2.Bin57]|nr:MAG: FtsQ-type POTRA domain-containing protein [Gloeocapsa sp. DLM2.Bin57]
MVRIEPINSNIDKQRRKELRWRRSLNFWQATWRLVFFSSLTAGVFWGLKLPYWMVETNQQIEVRGNRLMGEDDVRSLIALDYPEYLWRLNINNLIEQLESSQPIIDAEITRQVLPVRVNVYIQERQPVALVLASELNQQTLSPSKILLGFLDREGVFIPEHFYRDGDDFTQPTLTVIGFSPQYQSYWVDIFNFSQNSGVRIFEVEWTSSTVIMLKTELGLFYLGNYPTQLESQLEVIRLMKGAREPLDFSKIEYIDLSNPQLPSVKLKSS